METQIEILLALVNKSDSTVFQTILNETKKEFENCREKYMRGHMVRARANWIEHGEKPTKYFAGLEKRNYVNKNITKLVTPDGQTISDQARLLQTVNDFYKKLYTRNDDLCYIDLETLLNSAHNIPKLSVTERDLMEGPISLEEALKTIKNMKNGKAPGPDGFSADFFKFFGTTYLPF